MREWIFSKQDGKRERIWKDFRKDIETVIWKGVEKPKSERKLWEELEERENNKSEREVLEEFEKERKNPKSKRRFKEGSP